MRTLVSSTQEPAKTMSAPPLVPEVGTLALVPDRFDDLWMPRHQILTRLARYFHVVWVSPAHEWRALLRGGRTSKANGVGTYRAPAYQAPGFAVYTPESWLPSFYRPQWLADWSFRTRLQRARGILANRGCRKIILSLWRPEFEPALALVAHDLAAYHIDDEYAFSDVEVPLDEREVRLIAAANVVSVHSPGLLLRKGSINPRTVFVPNGVDYECYARPVPEPVDLAAIARPRVGYTGYLKRQLDWPLLLRLTGEHPQWSFVFVGPRRPHAEIDEAFHELVRRPNVHCLGAKSTGELATYPQHFDVCIMPYRVDHYTNHIYPLKLHEYLASGRPAVGTRIRTLEDFADVVQLARTAQEWSDAIAQALRPTAQSEGRRAARQAIARLHDWEVITWQIAEMMAQGLGPALASRLAEVGHLR